MSTGSNQPLTNHHINLNAAEIAQLWGAYLGNSMSVCFLKYFHKDLQDKEILHATEIALKMATDYVLHITKLFQEEQLPLPIGFTDADINLDAPPLYSDSLILNYLHQTTKNGIITYSVALGSCARADIRAFFSACLADVNKLFNHVVEVSLSKGLFQRAPFVTVSPHTEYVESPSFLNGFLGEVRSLNVLEINHLFSNIQSNSLGKALIMGFAQVARSTEIKEYFLRGKEIASHHIAEFSQTLINDNLPAPMTWDNEVTTSTVAPFSDKIMMAHVTGLNALGITNYGFSLAASQRHDLHALYTRLSAEIGIYAEQGGRLMIKNHWLEQTPLAPNREALTSS